MVNPSSYIGRFAPSPTGPLHVGSLVAAMASYLDAKAHHGHWLVRIEDIDTTRTLPKATQMILSSLDALGMHWDERIIWQSQRTALYETAFNRLHKLIYPCSCTRREIVDSQVNIDRAGVYPGTCRMGLSAGKSARAYRLRIPNPGDKHEHIQFDDRWMGCIQQHLATECGDFILKRADGVWAYQLAVVVDDGAQNITHVVRGADLLHSTPRQIYLQQQLGLITPQYLHIPVVFNEKGEKLSKQTGAPAINASQPLSCLDQAACVLGLQIGKVTSVAQFWSLATLAWANRENHHHASLLGKPSQ